MMKTNLKALLSSLAVASAVFATGCASTTTSNTARTGTEQLLISSAIDRAMSTVRFDDFAGTSVFVDEKYLDSVDKGYLVGSIRHGILKSGGSIAPAADKADVILEVRSGGIGTDGQESFVGIPAIGIPGLPIELPEVKVASRNTQMATAKLGFVCYDAKTGASLGGGGNSTALTHNNDTYVMGVGPFRSGSVLEQRERAVGFNGVGGSFMSAPTRVVRGTAVPLIKKDIGAMPGAYPDGVPQIATLPDAMLTK